MGEDSLINIQICRVRRSKLSFPTHIVSAGGFVEDGEGNILLVKTRNGGWVYPGGQVEVGENLMDALVREIKEESGIDTTISYLVGIYSNTGVFKWYDDPNIYKRGLTESESNY
jgi:ADP-ribose pyrophosphatase YjhB (NUDIX family)